MTKQEQEDLLLIKNDTVNHSVFSKLPEVRKTKLVCSIAVKITDYNIRFVPEQIMAENKNIISIALNCNLLNLEFIPPKLRTKDICFHVAQQNAAKVPKYVSASILNKIPFPDIRNEGFKMISEKAEYKTFDYLADILPSNIDSRLAEYAVSVDGNCIALIPSHLLTEELIGTSVFRSGIMVLKYDNIPKELIYPDFYLREIAHNIKTFFKIPFNERTDIQCLVAKKYYPSVFDARPEIVPEHIRNGNTIYALDERITKELNLEFNAMQLRELYNTGSIYPTTLTIPEGNIESIHYERANQKLTCITTPFKEKVNPETEEPETRRKLSI